MENKTHYRKVFKSDHLGIADLEDMIEVNQKLIFTIKEVKQYILTGDKNSGIVVAGKRISANIAYFKENIKPLVLNATNSKIVKSFAPDKCPFVETWKNIMVELYIDKSVKMKGDIVGGVRIKPTKPTLVKPELKPDMEAWNNAITFLKGEGSIDRLKVRYSLSPENEQKLKDASL